MIKVHEIITSLEHVYDKISEEYKVKLFEPFSKVLYNHKYGYKIFWNSRDHRKGRHPTVQPIENHDTPAIIKPKIESIKLWGWEPWNISYWVAQLFFWGSVVWVLNGILAMCPLSNSFWQDQLSGWTAFLGGFIFILGGYTAFLEAINQRKTLKLGHIIVFKSSPASKNGPITLTKPTTCHLLPMTHEEETVHEYKRRKDSATTWLWFETEKSNWGWWLNTAQLIGALIFFTACVTAIPGVLPDTAISQNRFYWSPQILGALFFVISSWMAMREVQQGIFSFPLSKLGWNVGLWNLVGAIGFFLCGYFGLITQGVTNSEYLAYWGAAFSTFWGSIAFLLSSYLMLIEILNKHTS